MILVDTSVLIDFFKGAETQKTLIFESILKQDLPYGIAPYTYQEVLQGARDEPEYEKIREYLATMRFYFLPETIDVYEESARMFFDLRRKGITVRSTIDILIALVAIRNNLSLLHNDRDFDAIASGTGSLKILEHIH